MTELQIAQVWNASADTYNQWSTLSEDEKVEFAYILGRSTETPEPMIPEGLTYWDDDPDYSEDDWLNEIDNGETRLGYWDWVINKKDEAANEEPDNND